MGSADGEVAVFADTNLGTRIVFNAHQDITAGALKRDFERVHFRCLPDSGEIQVDGLMVKRKSSFYYLPDSLPIKYVFPEMRRTWFLHVELRHSKCLCIPCSPYDAAILSKPWDMVACNSEDTAICDTEEKRMERFIENNMQNVSSRMQEEEKPTGPSPTNMSQYLMTENKVENPVKLHANSIQGSLSKMSTQVISVTDIINKYFSSFNGIKNFSSSSYSDVTSKAVCSEIEVQSNTRAHNCPKRQIDPLLQSTTKTPSVLHVPLHVDIVSRKSVDKKRRSYSASKISAEKKRGSKTPHVLHAPSHVDLVSKKSVDKKRRSHMVSKKSRDIKRVSTVGSRLLVASRCLGVSVIKHSPTLSFCKFKDRNLVEYKSQIKGSIFSISDSDD